MASIFTKLMRGEFSSYKILEDEKTFSFLTLDQIQLGHTLVVPKIEIDYFIDVPEPYYAAVFRNGQRISKAIQEVTDCKRVGMAVLGWDVPHFHLHLIPMFGTGDLDFSKAQQRSKTQCIGIQEKIIRRLEL